MSKIKKYQGEVKEQDGTPPVAPSNVTGANPKPVQPERPLANPSPTKDGAAFLQNFLKATPFFDQFESVAVRSYSAKLSNETKVAKHKSTHPRFHKVCVALDLVVRIVVVSGLLYVALTAALKVVS